MADESILALVELLRERNQALDQQIRELEQANRGLEEQMKRDCCDFRREQKQLKNELTAFQRKEEEQHLNEEERRRTDTLSQVNDNREEQIWMESALLRSEVANLKQQVRDHQKTFTEATVSILYYERQSSVNEEELRNALEQLEKCSQERAELLKQTTDKQSAPNEDLTLEPASDGIKARQDTRWCGLKEREKVLTCPISHKLFDEPVVTGCCGTTFSWEPLRQIFSQTSLCPCCHAPEGWVHRNPDMATLVELHRSERSFLTESDSTSAEKDKPAAPRRRQKRVGSLDIRQTRQQTRRSRRIQA